jgi:DNA-binding GntR family transcriptional regulator
VITPRRPIQNIEGSVYEELRDRVYDGSLAPGEPLLLADFADQLGVSTMPVRAALARLQTEGLVHHLRHRGFVVAPLELEDFQEIQAIRAGIEGFAVRLGAEQIGEAGLDRMRVLLEGLKQVSQGGRADEYLRAEWEYHLVCYSAPGRDRLVRIVQGYRSKAERYLRLVVSSSPGFQTPLVFQERLLELCSRHDGRAAEEMLREALGWSASQVGKLLQA